MMSVGYPSYPAPFAVVVSGLILGLWPAVLITVIQWAQTIPRWTIVITRAVIAASVGMLLFCVAWMVGIF